MPTGRRVSAPRGWPWSPLPKPRATVRRPLRQTQSIAAPMLLNQTPSSQTLASWGACAQLALREAPTETGSPAVKTSKKKYLQSVLLTSAALSLQAGSAALAEAADNTGSSGPTSSAELQEIVVTAEKRAEKLQDIPVAATAITSTDIERAGINNI